MRQTTLMGAMSCATYLGLGIWLVALSSVVSLVSAFLTIARANEEPSLDSNAAQTKAVATVRNLHVASPDWRDQIIYFVVTDRFNDGDPTNNDFAQGEFDPGSNAKYNGGDLRGIEQKLDYIRGLGATAIWITPPVANQWWDPVAKSSGYHGYWAENFMSVDRHLGTLDDYQRLSHAIHSVGMYLVQDIVVNHTGNFFSYDGAWSGRDPVQRFGINIGSRPVSAPSQWPFSLNDVRIPEHRRASIYHWTPNVADYTDPKQVLDFQMAGLDDLNTENALVRQTLRSSYAHWIRAVGVDAFRVDTAFYVPAAFFVDFMNSRDPRHPGITSVARQTGRNNFHVFGEGFAIDKPFADTQTRKIEQYMNASDGRALLPGMLNFPLFASMGDVFARGRPTAELAYRIRSMMKLHKRPHLMPTFVDNHDVDRFLAGGSQAALKQGVLMMMTLPGIPTIYYGTEQAFTEPRAAMFKSGFKSGGRDHFDIEAPLYRFISEASALRRFHRLFSRGVPRILKDNAATSGALAYRMSHGADSALVVFNSSSQEALLDNMDTHLPAGTLLQGLFGVDGVPAPACVGANGRISMKLPPQSGLVWLVTRENCPPPRSSALVTMRAMKGKTMRDDFVVSGNARGTEAFKLITDGNIADAMVVIPASDGTWAASIDTRNMLDPSKKHSVVAWEDTPPNMPPVISETRTFRVARDWTRLVDIEDPAGDDTGPRGSYVYPTDATYGANRQMDIRRVKISGAGGALKIDVTMHKVTNHWNPQNGFDHVAFTMFIEVPGRAGGTAVMPLQHGSLPGDLHWHYRLRAHGWSNALFSAEGASAEHEGTPVTPAADIRVDLAHDTVTFILPATSLGQLKSVSGVKLYITTWDYDGGYRALTPIAENGSIGGGNPATDVRVMDDTPIITLP